MSSAPFWRRFARNRSALAGAVLLAPVIAAALAAPLVAPGDPLDMVAQPFLWPGEDPAFLLGSDSLGRDVLAGLLHGARASLLIGIAATFAALLLGSGIGAFAGFYGGWIDGALMRVTEIFQTMPFFVLALVIVSVLNPSIVTIVAAIAVASWPGVARLMRGQVLALRNRDYVVASRSVGARIGAIILLQVLPNTLPPLIVTSSLMVATAILTEASLSFLGLGDPNLVTWGSMIGAGRATLRTAWYLTVLPGVAILLTVMAINLVGEGLNDALNPRLAA